MLSIVEKMVGFVLSVLGFPAHRQRHLCFRPYVLPVVVGLCLGITIHMMFAPFLEDSCDLMNIRDAASRHSGNGYDGNSGATFQTSTNSDDGFEARIVKPLPNATSADKSAPRTKLVRPRFIATELGIKDKLFVAVLTSPDSVGTFGVATEKTLSKYMSKVVFFSNEKPKALPTGLPLVSFGDNLPHLLPIHVLIYIKEHYVNNYDFFFILSDRTYLRANNFYKFVEHLSVSEDVHTGISGMDRNFCSPEGGVLFSQSVFQDIAPNLGWCLDNGQPGNPSLTLGRCLQHASHKLCTPGTEGKAMKYYPLEDFDFDRDIEALKKQQEFNESLVFYPIPDDTSYYKLHRYFCHVDLDESERLINSYREDIVELSKKSPGGQDSLTWPIGLDGPYKPETRYSLLQWTYFTDKHLYLDNELSNKKEITGIDKRDIDDIRATAMQNLNEKYHTRFEFKKLVNGYRRFDSTRGMEYILDLLVTDEKKDNSEMFKRVHLIRPLGKVELVPMPHVTENMMVTIILPLQVEHVAMFDVFMDSYARTCLQNGEDVRLIVALLYSNATFATTSSKDVFSRPKTMIQEYNKKFNTKGKLTWKAIVNAETDIQIIDALQKEFKTEVLILMTSVNVEMESEITSQFLNRVRMNTIKGKQVFFPIGFWQYKPNLTHSKKTGPITVEVGQRMGFFSTQVFDYASFYISDYNIVRKTLSPKSWKSGNIFEMFLASSNYHVFRAVEPNLKLKWMNLTCERTSEKYDECMSQNMEGLASQHHLALLVYEQRHEVISQTANQHAVKSASHKVKQVPVVPQDVDI